MRRRHPVVLHGHVVRSADEGATSVGGSHGVPEKRSHVKVSGHQEYMRKIL